MHIKSINTLFKYIKTICFLEILWSKFNIFQVIWWICMKSVEMTDKMPNEDYIPYYIMYEFHHGKKASVTTRAINQIFPYNVDIRKCQRWVFRFKVGNFDLFSAYRSGSSLTVDPAVIHTLIETNHSQTLIEMSS